MNEEEVEFNPRYEEEVSPYNRFVNESSTASAPTDPDATALQAQSASVNQSRRLDELELDVGQVKTKVNSIDAKLDMLIAAATTPKTSSTPARPRGQNIAQVDVRLPPPRVLRRRTETATWRECSLLLRR